MNNTADLLRKVVCGLTAVLVFMAGIAVVPAYAETGNVYVAELTPHYKNPATGEIEDSGGEGSAVLGQSMTESATYSQALIEKTDSGKLYVTIRLKLMDNIENPKFQVASSSGKKFKAVNATAMQENYTDNTADFRMEISSEHDIVRCAMYIVPMGRDVVYYMTISNLQAGSGDFITSIKPAKTTKKTDGTTKKDPVKTTKKAPKTTTSPQTTIKQQTTSAQSNKTQSTSAAGEISTTAGTSAAQTTTAVATPAPANGTTVLGIAEFDASGNAITEKSTGDVKEQKKSSHAGIIALVCVGIAAVIALVIWFVHRKKRG